MKYTLGDASGKEEYIMANKNRIPWPFYGEKMDKWKNIE